MEIWNNVFMEYNNTQDGLVLLPNKNVDTGMGFERIVTVMQGKDSVYDTDLFENVMKTISSLAKTDILESKRIVADHFRASAMIISDGIRPSNVDQGYVLRRLIRRALRHMRKLEIEFSNAEIILNDTILKVSEFYTEVKQNEKEIKQIFLEEVNKFSKTLVRGEKKFLEYLKENEDTLSGEIVFRLYDTYGFPPELTKEMAIEHEKDADVEGFHIYFKKHQETSRQGNAGKFQGGLQATGEMETKYHTATHLLNEALRRVLGEHVHQMGSNITGERLRFDFSNPEKVSPELLKQVEDLVNEQITKDLVVTKEVMNKEEAKISGAEAMFIEKYGDIVTVYSIGDFSKEICGGPHVSSTKELGTFKIKKEEASSSGVRRIKAILE